MWKLKILWLSKKDKLEKSTPYFIKNAEISTSQNKKKYKSYELYDVYAHLNIEKQHEVIYEGIKCI